MGGEHVLDSFEAEDGVEGSIGMGQAGLADDLRSCPARLMGQPRVGL